MNKHNARFKEEHIEFIRANAWHKSNAELTRLFMERFPNVLVTQTSIKSLKRRHGIQSGLTGRFEKGYDPWNKGRKVPPEVYEKMKNTMFKRGDKGKRWRPVGSRRVHVDGYIEIKTEEPRTWELEHKVLYEKAHGPIPNGYIVVHIDGNIQNNDINNLMMISRGASLIVNQNFNIGEDADINEAIYTAAEYTAKVNKMIKERRTQE